jgi:hypothetical protein
MRCEDIWNRLIAYDESDFSIQGALTGFVGVLLMPASPYSLDEPHIAKICNAISTVGELMARKQQGQGRAEFRELVRCAMAAFPLWPSWDADLVWQANVNLWPGWQVTSLPSLIVPLNPPDSHDDSWLVWNVYLHYLTSRGERPTVLQTLCDGDVQMVRLSNQREHELLREAAEMLEPMRIELPYTSPDALNGALLGALSGVSLALADADPDSAVRIDHWHKDLLESTLGKPAG